MLTQAEVAATDEGLSTAHVVSAQKGILTELGNVQMCSQEKGTLAAQKSPIGVMVPIPCGAVAARSHRLIRHPDADRKSLSRRTSCCTYHARPDKLDR